MSYTILFLSYPLNHLSNYLKENNKINYLYSLLLACRFSSILVNNLIGGSEASTGVWNNSMICRKDIYLFSDVGVLKRTGQWKGDCPSFWFWIDSGTVWFKNFYFNLFFTFNLKTITLFPFWGWWNVFCFHYLFKFNCFHVKTTFHWFLFSFSVFDVSCTNFWT